MYCCSGTARRCGRSTAIWKPRPDANATAKPAPRRTRATSTATSDPARGRWAGRRPDRARNAARRPRAWLRPSRRRRRAAKVIDDGLRGFELWSRAQALARARLEPRSRVVADAAVAWRGSGRDAVARALRGRFRGESARPPASEVYISAETPWVVRGWVSRRRRGRDADIPRRRVAATRRRIFGRADFRGVGLRSNAVEAKTTARRPAGAVRRV